MLRSGLAILGAAAVCAAGLAATSQKRPTPTRKICGRGIAGERPAWSPRGSQIAFVKGHRPYGIWLTTPDGRRIRRLKSSATFIGSVAWSPDGTKLAYDLATPQPGGEVHVMNADGSNDHPVGPGYAPSFSPDGTRLALLQPGAGWSAGLLDVMKVDGTERRTLARNVAAYSPPAWSPDGKTIAYGGPDVPASFESWITLVSSADGTVIRTVGEGADMRWSATNLIAYTAGLEDGSEVDLVRPSGAGRRTLALDLYQRYDFSPQVGRDDSQPSWSPNGKHLVFVANEKPRGQRTSLWLIDVTGRGEHRIASGCTFGTGGRDRIHGSPKRDIVFALEGDDRVDVLGGGKDLVDCGPGRDVIVADRTDQVRRNCERVVRR